MIKVANLLIHSAEQSAISFKKHHGEADVAPALSRPHGYCFHTIHVTPILQALFLLKIIRNKHEHLMWALDFKNIHP